MIENAKWYILHTYPGYENLVQANLEKLIEKHGLQDRIFEIAVPVEDTIEEKKGKRKVVQRKLLPCYVFVKIDHPEDLWHLITGIKGVTSFVGNQGRPEPLTEEEVRRMRLETVVVVIDIAVGDKVKVISGPLEGFIGDVEIIDTANSKCRVSVSMFGRNTPVELDIIQVERI